MTRSLCMRALIVSAAFSLIIVPPSSASDSRQAVDGATPPAEAIPYFVADGTGRTGYRAGDRELAAWALAAWQRSAGPTLRFEQAPEKQALLRVYWADPADGQYGEMVPFMIGERRGAALYIRPDTAALGPDIARQTRGDPLLRDSIVYLTCLHELGHALGLRHTDVFAEIMYSFQFGGDLVEYFMRYRRQLRSRADIASVSGLAASDIEHLRALYSARQPLLRLPSP
jgi:Matrixin